MHSVQNSCISSPSPINKTIASITSILAITAIALSIIGLTATSSGPVNAIVQLGITTNGIFFGTSIFVFILDLVWISALCKDKPSQSALLPATEEINDGDLVSDLPEEIILRAFGFLNEIELTKCGEVSRKWRRLASDPSLWNAFDLRKISPLLKVFDESDWATYVDLSSFGLDVTDAPSLDKRRVIPVLRRCLSSFPIEENKGVTLLTIPKGLTFNKLVKLAESPKMGNITKFRYISDRVLKKIGNIPVNKTYRIVITNNILKESHYSSLSKQKALLKKIGCEMPKTIEVTALLVVTFMSSGEPLYDDDNYIYTRCSEQFSGGFRPKVGGFVPPKPDKSPNGFTVYEGDDRFNYTGVGGILREF
jgi:hypothetical protein